MNEVAAALILKKKSLTNIRKVSRINFQGFLDFVILLCNIKSNFGTIKLHFNLFPIIKPTMKYSAGGGGGGGRALTKGEARSLFQLKKSKNGFDFYFHSGFA